MPSEAPEQLHAEEDWQAQLEELLALQSIFADDFRVTHIPGHALAGAGSDADDDDGSGGGSDAPGCASPQQLEEQLMGLLGSPVPACPSAGLMCCEATVHVELPAGQLQLLIDVRPAPAAAPAGPAEAAPAAAAADREQQQQQKQESSGSSSSSSSSSGMPFGPPVRYLPPLRVQLSLPTCYPSSADAPPAAALQACWLSAAHADVLQQQLQQLWLDQGPGPVCFTWLEHLKGCLGGLGVSSELLLPPPLQQQQREQQRQQQVQAEQQQGEQQQLLAEQQQLEQAQTQQQQQLEQAKTQQQQPAEQQDRDASTNSQQRQHRGDSAQQPAAVPGPPPPRQQHDAAGDAAAAPQLAAVSSEQLAVQLLRYSAAREQEAFNAATWTCGICFDEVPGSSCLRLPDCGHFYCLPCLRSTVASQLSCGAVESMRCPEPSCRQSMSPAVIKELLGAEAYARWEELLLSRTLDRMDDVVYCPRCEAACIEDADHSAQCPGCLYVFCSFCSDSWHPGVQCLDPHERLRVLERRKGACSARDRAHQLDLVNQMMSVKYLTDVSRKCPSCGMATIKNEGCNKMTCGYCAKSWCWKCQQVISGYDHFRESRCVMFDQAEVDRWNAAMWANQRAREVEAGQAMMQVVRGGMLGVQFCRCPVCGQENLREGRNNLLRCWSCTSHFCYACRTWLRSKVGAHFMGPGSCRQHS